MIVPGSLAGLLRPVQETSIFQSQEVKVDGLGNVIGFSLSMGRSRPTCWGACRSSSRRRSSSQQLRARLLIKVAIADTCSLAPADTVAAGKVNLWIPDNGSQYATSGKATRHRRHRSPATLIVNRDLVANPMPPACGAGVDVTVTPSAADVDANLAIPGVWGIGATGAAQSVRLVEYYNASLDHYFITWVPDEIAKLDDGSVIKGWARTGRTMRTYKSAQAGTSPVCRFYIPPAFGDSHFFGRGTAECAATAQKNPSFVARGLPVHADVPAGPGRMPGQYAAGLSGIQQPAGREPPLHLGQATREQMAGQGMAGRR